MNGFSAQDFVNKLTYIQSRLDMLTTAVNAIGGNSRVDTGASTDILEIIDDVRTSVARLLKDMVGQVILTHAYIEYSPLLERNVLFFDRRYLAAEKGKLFFKQDKELLPPLLVDVGTIGGSYWVDPT